MPTDANPSSRRTSPVRREDAMFEVQTVCSRGTIRKILTCHGFCEMALVVLGT